MVSRGHFHLYRYAERYVICPKYHNFPRENSRHSLPLDTSFFYLIQLDEISIPRQINLTRKKIKWEMAFCFSLHLLPGSFNLWPWGPCFSFSLYNVFYDIQVIFACIKGAITSVLINVYTFVTITLQYRASHHPRKFPWTSCLSHQPCSQRQPMCWLLSPRFA